MGLEDLKKHIKQNKIGNLYLFYGPEEYLKEYYLKALEDKLLQPSFKQLNYYRMEGKVSQDQIIDACDTFPAFDARKLVLVKESGLFKAGAAKITAKSDFGIFLSDLPEYVCLIFYQESVDKRSSLYKLVSKNGCEVDFEKQKSASLEKWVINILAKNGKTIGPDLAAMLVEYSEPDMHYIYNEIEKLIQYLGEREAVAREDIERISIRSIKGRIFDLTDAVSEKNISKAMRYLDEMIQTREPVPRILFMLNRQFRILLHMKDLQNTGVSGGEMAKRLGIMPFLVSKVKKQADRYTKGQLQDMMRMSLELDVAIKTGQMNNQRLAIELMIAAMTGFRSYGRS